MGVSILFSYPNAPLKLPRGGAQGGPNGFPGGPTPWARGPSGFPGGPSQWARGPWARAQVGSQGGPAGPRYNH